MKKFAILFSFLFLPSLIFSHHGIAAIGSIGLEGPGAPLETSSSAPLPEGSYLFYLKLDDAVFEKYTKEVDDEKDYSHFWMYGIGYGLKSWLSLYLFLPYNVKTKEDNSYNTAGFADLSIMYVFGFKYDEGFKLVPKNESIDDLRDWHFTFYGCFSLPRGDENLKNNEGEIEPDFSLGFGKPSYSFGFTATKMFSEKFTYLLDTNYIIFKENKYENGIRYKFGNEFRLNNAIVYIFYKNGEKKKRVDGGIELNYLNLRRDKEEGIDLEAAGGDILYLVPNIRYYIKNFSLGFGLKFPLWKDLNEESLQQGSEGKEKYRAILTISFIL